MGLSGGEEDGLRVDVHVPGRTFCRFNALRFAIWTVTPTVETALAWTEWLTEIDRHTRNKFILISVHTQGTRTPDRETRETFYYTLRSFVPRVQGLAIAIEFAGLYGVINRTIPRLAELATPSPAPVHPFSRARDAIAWGARLLADERGGLTFDAKACVVELEGFRAKSSPARP